MDYFIRAKRLEEIPLLEAHAAETAVTKRDNWEKLEADRVRLSVYCYSAVITAAADILTSKISVMMV